jgi:hypothetical protein
MFQIFILRNKFFNAPNFGIQWGHNYGTLKQIFSACEAQKNSFQLTVSQNEA